MSTLQVANIHLESTGNNRIQYAGSNTFTMYAGGVGILVVNSTAIAIGANVTANATAFDVGNTIIKTSNAIFGGTITVNGSIGTAGQVLTSSAGVNAYWSSSQSIGIGQTWQDVSGSRTFTTSFQNLTGRPIVVSLSLDSTGRDVEVSVDNVTWVTVAQSSGNRTSMSFIVPANSYYRINGSTTINVWAELR